MLTLRIFFIRVPLIEDDSRIILVKLVSILHLNRPVVNFLLSKVNLKQITILRLAKLEFFGWLHQSVCSCRCRLKRLSLSRWSAKLSISSSGFGQCLSSRQWPESFAILSFTAIGPLLILRPELPSRFALFLCQAFISLN